MAVLSSSCLSRLVSPSWPFYCHLFLCMCPSLLCFYSDSVHAPLYMSGWVKISVRLCIFSPLSLFFFISRTHSTFTWFTMCKQTVLLFIIAMKYRCKLVSHAYPVHQPLILPSMGTCSKKLIHQSPTSPSSQSAPFFCPPLWSPLEVSSPPPPLLLSSPIIGMMSQQGKMEEQAWFGS